MNAAPGTSAWPAPAKINRFLHILGRRGDGYHDLQTLFQFLDHGDTVYVRLRDDGRILRARDLPGVPEANDLTVRAARQLQGATGCTRGAELAVTKRLPSGGGLGGGSSDAATVLVALNHLWGCGLSSAELAQLGLQLGADVPVFVHGRAAWAEGIGERLQPVEPDEPWFVVLVPDVAVSTAAVFGDRELTRGTPPITMSAFRSGGAGNDCERVVRTRYPPVEAAFRALGAYGDARLTGTGGCVFLVAPERADAEAALAGCQRAGWQGFVARGRNRSPLLERLEVAAEEGVIRGNLTTGV